MKAVILAGGLGTRLGEETALKPKPLVEIGGRPIIWHIMKHYSYYGINEFIILLGYKGYMIKEFFDNYRRHLYDMRINFKENKSEILRKDINTENIEVDNWIVDLIYTGENTETGGRLKKVYDYLKNEESFCLTYGDGVSNVNIKDELEFHKSHKKIATITAVFPPARWGAISINSYNTVTDFIEKPRGDNAYINGGFFVLNREIFDYLENDRTVFEQKPLRELAKNNELIAFKHEGFWQCMDTQRDKVLLEEMWSKGNAPWKTWK
ncbi:glucose-1-phosphate cytidylyltransferase [uncultured Brachyspira sp.]|uniref:glucose-1-phosphate cytidylyltransferase n=2 Tax=uncultured Brachyspira sp. TaxID=221953 RepID=UPI002624BA81|nr:glucose-1-phosphate cytidylyltransferase [uncultured Brachyspira sp.]